MKKLRMHAVVGRMQAPSTSTCVATLGAALLLVHLWRRRRPRFAFDGPLDRSGVHTVKHELPVLMHGEAAGNHFVEEDGAALSHSSTVHCDQPSPITHIQSLL